MDIWVRKSCEFTGNVLLSDHMADWELCSALCIMRESYLTLLAQEKKIKIQSTVPTECTMLSHHLKVSFHSNLKER